MSGKTLLVYLRQTFGFSRREARGFIFLTISTMVLMFIPFLLHEYYLLNVPKIEDDRTLLESMLTELHTKEGYKNAINKPTTERQQQTQQTKYFIFDPNSATQKQLEALGINEKLSQRIINYRNKGGRFKQKEDFLKIYGMSTYLYEKLSPYILIESQSGTSEKALIYTDKYSPIDLNIADSISLLTLKGIGPTLAGRVVKYRKQLGGFYTTEQLKEVYGIKEDVFEALKSKVFIEKSFNPNKISLLSCNYQILYAHPYFRKFAGVIMKQKKTQVNITAQMLLTQGLLMEQDYERMLPYLANE